MSANETVKQIINVINSHAIKINELIDKTNTNTILILSLYLLFAAYLISKLIIYILKRYKIRIVINRDVV